MPANKTTPKRIKFSTTAENHIIKLFSSRNILCMHISKNVCRWNARTATPHQLFNTAPLSSSDCSIGVEIFSHELHESHRGTHVRDIEHD